MKPAWSKKPRKYRLEWADADRLLTPCRSVDYDDVETFNRYFKGRTVTVLEEEWEDEGAYMAHMNAYMRLDNGVELYFYGSTPCGCGCHSGGDVAVGEDIPLPLGPIEKVETGGEQASGKYPYDDSWLTVTVVGEEIDLLSCAEASEGYGDTVFGFGCTVTDLPIKPNKGKGDELWDTQSKNGNS